MKGKSIPTVPNSNSYF